MRNLTKVTALAAAMVLMLSACADKTSSSESSVGTVSSETGVQSENSANKSENTAENFSTDTVGNEALKAISEAESKAQQLISSISTASAQTQITLDGTGASISGSGATAKDAVVTISSAGSYEVSGTLSNGQIIIDADKDAAVTLILSGVSITCADGAAIYAKSADVTNIILADGTQNTLTDGKSYSSLKEDNDPNTALIAKDDHTISRNGAHTVNGNYKNGIGTKDTLAIAGGNITVAAANDGIKGHDALLISGGTFNVTAGNDAFQSDTEDDTSKGWVSVSGGDFTVKAVGDGFAAGSALKITAGAFDITTTGTDAQASAKGLKGLTAVFIGNGAFKINSSDDSVHSNGTVDINGGAFDISSGDDGFHADKALNINNGVIDITKCVEGLEAAEITVNSGEISIIASDDGINAAGGNDGSQADSPRGRDMFTADNSFIKINGGEIYVNSSGDGIDSNGALNFTGGNVTVDGPTNDGNGALDYNGECIISGGTLIAAGSSGMAQAPQESSEQNSVIIGFTSDITAGTEVSIVDSSGKTVISYSPKKSFRSVVFSTADIKTGEKYTVKYGGETLEDFTVSSAFTTVGTVGGMGMWQGGGNRPSRFDGQTPPDGFDGKTPPEGFDGKFPTDGGGRFPGGRNSELSEQS